MVKSSEIDKIKYALVKSLTDNGIPVNRIILYGSYARGSHKPYSDIDIAVISSAFEGKSILKRQELLGEAIYNLGQPIEALGYTPREYRNPPVLSFLSEIISTGKLIYKS